MTDKDKKEYYKAYYQAHKEEHNARSKAYYKAHKEERNAYYQAHKEEHKAWEKAHRKERNDYKKAYQKSDTNSLGQTKESIRRMSRKYLFNILNHNKLEGYEIHHCFGYEDYRNFIYIPRELHLEIHKFLRDNDIDADSNHYNQIEHIIVNYLKYKERHILVLRR